jgi:hypothetical protein
VKLSAARWAIAAASSGRRPGADLPTAAQFAQRQPDISASTFGAALLEMGAEGLVETTGRGGRYRVPGGLPHLPEAFVARALDYISALTLDAAPGMPLAVVTFRGRLEAATVALETLRVLGVTTPAERRGARDRLADPLPPPPPDAAVRLAITVIATTRKGSLTGKLPPLDGVARSFATTPQVVVLTYERLATRDWLYRSPDGSYVPSGGPAR